ncbi:hypothetical protein MPH_05760 [Macrophomina phaseolina MS6]|uniref:Uncharacterized protein n=1 Tax=Macrophomina phaseolina (strain MS6) TaxID=1126212 RepID=K2SJV5_MACPH|nr:hypothetical protein MPH_05760 [Macrophomina phaseolina MS6]
MPLPSSAVDLSSLLNSVLPSLGLPVPTNPTDVPGVLSSLLANPSLSNILSDLPLPTGAPSLPFSTYALPTALPSNPVELSSLLDSVLPSLGLPLPTNPNDVAGVLSSLLANPSVGDILSNLPLQTGAIPSELSVLPSALQSLLQSSLPLSGLLSDGLPTPSLPLGPPSLPSNAAELASLVSELPELSSLFPSVPLESLFANAPALSSVLSEIGELSLPLSLPLPTAIGSLPSFGPSTGLPSLDLSSLGLSLTSINLPLPTEALPFTDLLTFSDVLPSLGLSGLSGYSVPLELSTGTPRPLSSVLQSLETALPSLDLSLSSSGLPYGELPSLSLPSLGLPSIGAPLPTYGNGVPTEGIPLESAIPPLLSELPSELASVPAASELASAVSQLANLPSELGSNLASLLPALSTDAPLASALGELPYGPSALPSDLASVLPDLSTNAPLASAVSQLQNAPSALISDLASNLPLASQLSEILQSLVPSSLPSLALPSIGLPSAALPSGLDNSPDTGISLIASLPSPGAAISDLVSEPLQSILASDLSFLPSLSVPVLPTAPLSDLAAITSGPAASAVSDLLSALPSVLSDGPLSPALSNLVSDLATNPASLPAALQSIVSQLVPSDMPLASALSDLLNPPAGLPTEASSLPGLSSLPLPFAGGLLSLSISVPLSLEPSLPSFGGPIAPYSASYASLPTPILQSPSLTIPSALSVPTDIDSILPNDLFSGPPSNVLPTDMLPTSPLESNPVSSVLNDFSQILDQLPTGGFPTDNPLALSSVLGDLESLASLVNPTIGLGSLLPSALESGVSLIGGLLSQIEPVPTTLLTVTGIPSALQPSNLASELNSALASLGPLFSNPGYEDYGSSAPVPAVSELPSVAASLPASVDLSSLNPESLLSAPLPSLSALLSVSADLSQLPLSTGGYLNPASLPSIEYSALAPLESLLNPILSNSLDVLPSQLLSSAPLLSALFPGQSTPTALAAATSSAVPSLPSLDSGLPGLSDIDTDIYPPLTGLPSLPVPTNPLATLVSQASNLLTNTNAVPSLLSHVVSDVGDLLTNTNAVPSVLSNVDSGLAALPSNVIESILSNIGEALTNPAVLPSALSQIGNDLESLPSLLPGLESLQQPQVSSLDLSSAALPSIGLSSAGLSSIGLPSEVLPSVELPSATLPSEALPYDLTSMPFNPISSALSGLDDVLTNPAALPSALSALQSNLGALSSNPVQSHLNSALSDLENALTNSAALPSALSQLGDQLGNLFTSNLLGSLFPPAATPTEPSSYGVAEPLPTEVSAPVPVSASPPLAPVGTERFSPSFIKCLSADSWAQFSSTA